MDDRFARIEAGLERLVPRGVSETGRAALEGRIDELAAAVEDPGRRHTIWKLGAAAAAMVAGVAVWSQQNGGEVPPVTREAPGERFGPETVSSAVQVNLRFDGGWTFGDGSRKPYRYHGYEVTDETEVVDPESGYEVVVRERREEWIPVVMTSL